MKTDFSKALESVDPLTLRRFAACAGSILAALGKTAESERIAVAVLEQKEREAALLAITAITSLGK